MNIRAVIALGLSVTLWSGCDDDSTIFLPPPDLGVTVAPHPSPSPACQAGQKECTDSDLFRLCHSDGTWGADQLCPDGTGCAGGSCAALPVGMQPCIAGDSSCISGMPNMILTCRAAGSGFDAKSCPANTQCTSYAATENAPALTACGGGCGAAGSTRCNDDPSKIDSCDGNVVTTTACPSGKLCVTGADGVDACLTADCDPSKTCVVCGNPTISSLDPGTTVSICTNSPLGYKWESVKCPAPTTVCDPKAGGACGAGGFDADCVVALGAVCTPGQTRCTVAKDGVQSCNTKGQWDPPSTCSSTQACLLLDGNSDSSAPQAVCGDRICSVAAGACVLDGGVEKLRPCVNGALAATASACSSGLCVGSGTVNGLISGACQTQCQAGESRCLDQLGYQSCTGGLWSSSSSVCATGICADTLAGALRVAICGACKPGARRCVNSVGNLDGGVASPLGDLETCGPDGQWGAATPCTVGVCNAGSCVAQCAPGAPVCLGFNEPSPPPLNFGTMASLPCQANGLLPSLSGPCPGATGCCQPVNGQPTACRKDQNGIAIGCVVCVAGTNEGGIVDTRCTDGAGVPTPDDACGGTAVEQCLSTADGTGSWSAPSPCLTGATCVPEFSDDNTPAFCVDPADGICN